MNQHLTNRQASSPLLHPAVAEDGTSAISRRHLHDELLIRLRDCIIDGELVPGAKIPEKELCERFGVSRTPLREALKVLAFEGLVILNHNRGAIVKPLTFEDLSYAFPVYTQLETLAGELACERMSAKEIDEIKRLHERMVAACKQKDAKGQLAINEQIHERIHLGSQNRNLIQLLHHLSSRIRRARMAVIIPVARLRDAIAEHERIMAALERRDAPLLSRAIRDHLENTFRAMKAAFAAQETLPARRAGKRDLGTSEAA